MSDSAADGNAYFNSFDLLTKYIVCAICGYEGSRVGCVTVTEVSDLLEMSGIASKFNDIVCADRIKTRFDAIFNVELNTCFKDDLIRDIDSRCRGCYRQLLRTSATTTHKMQGSTVNGNCVTLATNLRDRTPFTRGIDYVCHSRARELSSLFFVHALRPEHFTCFGADRKKVHAEYKRLRLIFGDQ